MKLSQLLDPLRREKEIFSLIVSQANISLKTTESLLALVSDLQKGDRSSAEVEQSLTARHESEADRLALEASIQIAKGAFFGGIREDFLTLIELIDDIADAAWDASKVIFGQFVASDKVAEFSSWQETQQFLNTAAQAVRELIILLEMLPNNKKAVFDRIALIRELEERADAYKSEAMKKLFSKNGSYDPLMVVQLRDFLNIADDIADKSQDSTQIILIMLAKGF
ncbi:MAG: DUF47 family protein [Thermoprotei archaeon]